MAHRLTRSAPRWLAAAGLVLAVSGVHVGVTAVVTQRVAAFDLSPPAMQRVQVAYVREMALSVPVARAAPAAAPPRRRVPTRAPAVAASQPAPDHAARTESPQAANQPANEPAKDAVNEAPSSAPEPASSVAAAPGAASHVADPADNAPVFEWPVSTRLRYLLSGYVRGEVHGQAQVEWVRVGQQYQVHLDVEVGPSFAPLATRRMSSDGRITPDGLVPRYYEQETRLAFDRAYRAVVRFEDDRVWLANGLSMPHMPGLQDTASQFVQLAYLFDREPQRLRVGEVVELLLAMPRNVSAWVYDVVAQETLYTPFGEVPAFHLKPRREPRAGGDLVTELWIAPGLRHLPVRFRIRQDAENHVDLMLDRRPELAAPDSHSGNSPENSPDPTSERTPP